MPLPQFGYEGEQVMTDRDWVTLIDAAGGESSESCTWSGCDRPALRSKRICVRHAYPDLS